MKMTVLLYHRLFDSGPNSENYEISAKAFENHIRYLAHNNFQSLSFSDVYSGKTSKAGENKKSVFITFDDGSYSDYSIAFPILKKYNFTATFFITVDWVGTENYVNLLNLKEMVAGGMSIQSHGLSHSFLSDLKDADLHNELSGSKNYLMKNLGIPVDVISIPGGFFSKKVLHLAEKNGYKGACTSVPGLNNLNGDILKFQTFNRFVMTRKTPFQSFEAMVNQDYKNVLKGKAIYGIKAILKKALGSRGYYLMWSKFFREVSDTDK